MIWMRRSGAPKPRDPNPFPTDGGFGLFVFWLRGFYSETLLRLRNFQISSIIQSIGDALGTHCRRGGVKIWQEGWLYLMLICYFRI